MSKKRATSDVITPPEIKDALQRSGYLLESRLDSLLRHMGYLVYANSAYPDPLEKKSREVDIVAHKAFDALKPVETETHHIKQWIFPVLMIECLNNLQPVAFFTKSAQLPHIDHYCIRMAGIPLIIKDREDASGALLCDFLNMNKYHHYCHRKVATQFCSFKAKNERRADTPEWMAWHEDSHYSSFQKLAAVLEHRVDEQANCHAIGGINIEVYYPLVVLQGELLEVEQKAADLEIAPADHVRLVFSQTINSAHREYHIDVIKESFLVDFVAMVEGEISRMVGQIKRKQAQVEKALNILLGEVERADSKEGVRDILGF